MAKPRRRRAGRPRKVGAVREPSGKLSRATYREPIIPEAAIEQRARMAPKADRDSLRTEGTPLALLRANGDITTMQFDAGEKYGELHRRWARAASVPPRWPVPGEGGGNGEDVSREQWERLKQAVADTDAALTSLPQWQFVATALASICTDEAWTPFLEQRHPMRGRVLHALTAGLDVMARHFKIAPREQKRDAA